MAASACVFCDIVNREESGGRLTEILYDDESVIAFRDIRPATNHHYLIVAKQHISSPKTLTSDNLDLVKHMCEVGRRVLTEQGCENAKDTRFGYHWPPFNAINHLHLHTIGNTHQMGLISKGIFMSGSPWFVSQEWLVNKLGNGN